MPARRSHRRGHYEIGFHSTGTLGTFGAAARRLTCSGSTKPLDAGDRHRRIRSSGTEIGVRNDDEAAPRRTRGNRRDCLRHCWRAAGFSSAADVLEAKQGFAATHAGGALDEARSIVSPAASSFATRSSSITRRAT